MSLEIIVYCKEVSNDLIPQMMKRLNDYDMVTEVHPEFNFNGENAGFLPFKFRLSNPHLDTLKEKDLISGFELYIGDFNLQKAKEDMRPKQSFFEKLIGKKQPEIQFAAQEIEDRLKDCKKEVHFVWHSGDSFQLRFALLTSAIFAELTNGVCTYPADDIWYDNQGFTDKTFKEILEYENSLNASKIKFFEFQNW